MCIDNAHLTIVRAGYFTIYYALQYTRRRTARMAVTRVICLSDGDKHTRVAVHELRRLEDRVGGASFWGTRVGADVVGVGGELGGEGDRGGRWTVGGRGGGGHTAAEVLAGLSAGMQVESQDLSYRIGKDAIGDRI